MVGSVAGARRRSSQRKSVAGRGAPGSADISLARRLLGYAPEVGLEQGLNDLLKIDGQFERRKLVVA